MRIEIPEKYWYAWMVDEFIAWVQSLKVQRSIDKKIIVCQWCDMTGYPLTKELVDRVYPRESPLRLPEAT